MVKFMPDLGGGGPIDGKIPGGMYCFQTTEQTVGNLSKSSFLMNSMNLYFVDFT